MKVYFTYEGKDANGVVVDTTIVEAYKLKVDIPSKWLSGPCKQLLQFVVTTYNKKDPEQQLNPEELSMWLGNVELKPTDIVESRINEYNDIRIVHTPKGRSGQNQQPEGSIICTNYGCGQYFLPGENNDTACKHHKEPPVFHDIEKYWRCCTSRRARDWEEFKAIPACCTGPHSTENQAVSFASAPVANVPLASGQAAAITGVNNATAGAPAERRTTGPREFEAAVREKRRDEPQAVVDGKAKCRNFGCQQEFIVADNHPTACHYHSEGPVFWDTYRYWKCCPDKKCFDFDDFVKVPGCSVGPHLL
ncbi:hypothetical protein, conserved [Trypanosoma brucei gambiense DAL972]|uniref:CHORD domain-containing protein n=2 Tax=Trypanosoma brucei TaxID=5691 RepID=C9ZIN5_TRYB9|nr:hypothetical protein, conserved [Trypanosoma brucei gambiense DAL972]RHW74426.1 Cysteine and histidine-rich domain-containing protein [Trypanosoma brucei equiperdum]CBH09027.1 hypothetical protein, conserved [Trypanosoma brucei gambiense DAL972]|eukprot:XP_011771468.1 hypothetical protein, conserved [Trypanosoma brucei gambiense DAL972]